MYCHVTFVFPGVFHHILVASSSAPMVFNTPWNDLPFNLQVMLENATAKINLVLISATLYICTILVS